MVFPSTLGPPPASISGRPARSPAGELAGGFSARGDANRVPTHCRNSGGHPAPFRYRRQLVMVSPRQGQPRPRQLGEVLYRRRSLVEHRLVEAAEVEVVALLALHLLPQPVERRPADEVSR